MPITCCKDCKERHVGCHSICEKYKQQKIKNDEVNNRRLEYVRSNEWTYNHRQAKINAMKSKSKLHRGVAL